MLARTETDDIYEYPTVLIADDDPASQTIISTLLQAEPVRVIIVDNSLSALTRVADEKPTLIILSSHLPRLSGYQICQIIRKNLSFQAIPIIILDESNDFFGQMRTRLAGATDYLGKPFDSDQFMALIKKHTQ